MKKTYCELMDGLTMSDHSRQAFYEKLRQTKKRPAALRIALIAACLCLCLTGIAYGAKLITGVSITRLITDGKVFDEPIAGDEMFEKFTHGYSADFPDVQAYPLSAFTREVQNTTETTMLRFQTLEDIEAHLGITFCENEFLDIFSPRPRFDNTNGVRKMSRYHFSIFTSHGQPSQAGWSANYNVQGIPVDISTRLAIQNPTIPAEDVPLYLKQFQMLEEENVRELSQEQYTAPNGLTVTIVTLGIASHPNLTYYIANFAIDHITYSVTVESNHTNVDKDAVAVMKSILDGYIIQ